MERIYRIILEQHLRRLNAEVTLAAWSSFAPGSSLGCSRPHGYKLVYVTKGTGWFEVDGKRALFKPGTLSMLPAGTEQSCGVSGTEPVEAYWAQFDANLGDTELIGMLKLPVCVDVGGDPDIVRLFEAMIESFNDSAITSVLRSKAALYEVLARFLEKCRVDEKAIANMDLFVRLGNVLDYIDRHLADNLTLEELAKMAYLHPNYFVSLFKNLIGLPPIHYVNMRRLEKARKLLEETDIHVSEIAAAVGMQNHYLSRLFKQHTGLSPTRYRKLYGGRKALTADATRSAGGPHVSAANPVLPGGTASEADVPGQRPVVPCNGSAVPGEGPFVPGQGPAVPERVLPKDATAGKAGLADAAADSDFPERSPVPAATGTGGAGYGFRPD